MRAPFEHPNSLRIFGPAGSGKTRALIDILRRHVEDGDFELGEGIIVSFTRAAAYDIARRVNPEGEPARYHTTLHALCKRYYGLEGELAEAKLREFFGERSISYREMRSPDPEEWASSAESNNSEGALLHAFWGLCRNSLVRISEGMRIWRPDASIERFWAGDRMKKLWLEYVAWKKEVKRIDFTDMLEVALKDPPRSMQWPFFVLDEAQDSTPLQWAVAQAFARCSEVAYIAGDDDQAIYGWSGASPEEFLGANVTLDDVLHVNHRSGAAIVDAAQAFIRKNKHRRDKGMTSSRAGGEVVTAQSNELPEVRLDESCFVMARAWYLLGPLLEEMEALNIPFVDRRGRYGVTGKAAVPYQRWSRLASGQTISLDEWHLLLNFIPARPWLMPGEKSRVARMDKLERIGRNVNIETIGNYGATEELALAIRAGSLEPLKLEKARLAYLEGVRQRHGLEYLSQERAAKVCQAGSIHAFKGLEADHAIIHSGMPPMAARESYQDPEPERRVIYVALTRAKERVTHYRGEAYDQWEARL